MGRYIFDYENTGKLIKLFKDNKLSKAEIARVFNVSNSAITQQYKKLKDKGLI